jgi:hypothetical protein
MRRVLTTPFYEIWQEPTGKLVLELTTTEKASSL